MYGLVSFCNQLNKFSNLCLVNLSNFEKIWIPVFIPNNGITGLCQNENYIFVAYQYIPNDGIIVFRKKNFEIISTIEFETIDIHSIFFDKGIIYANKTNSDSIVKFVWDETKKQLYGPDVFWKNRDALKIKDDSLHINSIIKYQENMYISSFGTKVNGSFEKSKFGFIKNITTGKIIYSKLDHPHSLGVFNDEIVFCESMTRRVYKNKKIIFENNKGYLRGLDINKNILIVGVSKGRKISKSTGNKRTFTEIELNIDTCRLVVYDVKKEIILKEVKFWPGRTEIYDCIILDDISDEYEKIVKQNYFEINLNKIPIEYKVLKNECDILQEENKNLIKNNNLLILEKAKIERKNELLKVELEKINSSRSWKFIKKLRRYK
jgi:hypothetical protein